MTTIPAPLDHLMPTAAYNDLLDTLMNLPPHFDRRTQLVELLGAAGIWPLSVRADHDAAELVQAELDVILRQFTTPLTEADSAALETYRVMQHRFYEAEIELAKSELAA